MYMYVVMKDSNICRHICMCTIFNLYVYTHPKKYAHMFISGGVACWTYGHFEDPAVIGLGLPTEWWNHLSWCVTDWVSAVQHIGADPAYPASQRLVADWLIDWWIDWLIDGLMDWWIDWLIDGLMDWLIDWLILMICMILMRFIVITLAVMMLTVSIKLKARSRSGQLATYEPR